MCKTRVTSPVLGYGEVETGSEGGERRRVWRMWRNRYGMNVRLEPWGRLVGKRGVEKEALGGKGEADVASYLERIKLGVEDCLYLGGL